MMGDMGAMMGHGMMMTFMGFASLAGLGVLALAVVGLVAGIRWLVKDARRSEAGQRADSALAVLRERYARGEISPGDFQRMQQDIA